MRETMSLSLTPEQSSFVSSCVATGRYQSASEVVRAGLRLLADQEAARLAELDAIRGLVKQGADSVDRGELIDADQFLNALKGKYVTPSSAASKVSPHLSVNPCSIIGLCFLEIASLVDRLCDSTSNARGPSASDLR